MVQCDDLTVDLQAVNGVAGEPSDVSDTGTVVGSLLAYDKNGFTVSRGPLAWHCEG